jgi:hypothetical protein
MDASDIRIYLTSKNFVTHSLGMKSLDSDEGWDLKTVAETQTVSEYLEHCVMLCLMHKLCTLIKVLFFEYVYDITLNIKHWCPSQWPRRPRHNLPFTARTLGSWVRILLDVCPRLSVLCCPGIGLIHCSRSPTKCSK